MNLEEETIKAEYYPYPPNSTWEEKEEINKKHIEEWKKYLKPLTKTELTDNNTMKNKTFDDFERQFATMCDSSPDEIREFIATIILAAAHDNSLVDAAFEWVASKNNKN